MNIGILTLPLHTNYGGILQAFALYHTLSNFGHNVYLIDGKMYEISTWKEKLSIIKWYLLKSIGLKSESHPQLILNRKMKKLIPFIDKYIPQQMSLDKVKRHTFDAIVVGSDQIWRGAYNCLLPYFLDFAYDWNIKRIAYAASFGVDNWQPPKGYFERCTLLISKFDYVSVREKTAVDVCKTLFHCKAEWVLDPTMLLEGQDYMRIAKKSEMKMCGHSCKYLLTYVLDRSHKDMAFIKKVAEFYNLEIVSLESPDSLDLGLVSVEEWLGLIEDSSFVVTDSFHGTVFSILFNKTFIVLDNQERGNSRFDSLLDFLGLKSRMSQNSFCQKIDWNVVNEKILKERKRCLTILSEILK